MTTIDEALERDRAIPDLDWHVFPDGTVLDAFASPSGPIARVRLGDPDAQRVLLISGVAGAVFAVVILVASLRYRSGTATSMPSSA